MGKDFPFSGSSTDALSNIPNLVKKFLWFSIPIFSTIFTVPIFDDFTKISVVVRSLFKFLSCSLIG